MSATLFPCYEQAILDLYGDDWACLPPVALHPAPGDRLVERLALDCTPQYRLRTDVIVKDISDVQPIPAQGETEVDIEDYFRGRLGTTMSALAVFEEIERCVTPGLRKRASDAAEDAHWNFWNGLLLSPRVRHLLRQCREREGDLALSVVEGGCWYISPTLMMEDARRGHAAARTNLLALAAQGDISVEVLSAGEFFSDYVLLQRAVWEDLRSVARSRAAAERTSYLLSVRRRAGQLCFAQTWAYLADPESVAKTVGKSPPASVVHFANEPRIYSGTPAWWTDGTPEDCAAPAASRGSASPEES
jgi:hypothetical protein